MEKCPRPKHPVNNGVCFECKMERPKWTSINNGIFICLVCAGQHRSFGVHVSFVRSLEMDELSDLQRSMLKFGGNRNLHEFLKLYGLENAPFPGRYETKACKLYRDKLKKMAEDDKAFIFTKNILQALPKAEGAKTMYGKRYLEKWREL